MNVEELRGWLVIAINGGERMGQVSDAVLDLWERRLVSLLVTSGGLISGSRRTLLPVAIHRIGTDAIMIQTRADLRDGDDVSNDLTRASDLRRRAAVTESG